MSFIGVVEVFRQTQILSAAKFNFTPYVATGADLPRGDDPARAVHRLADRPRAAPRRERPGPRTRRGPARDGGRARDAPAATATALSIQGLWKSFGELAGPVAGSTSRSPSTRSSRSSARRGAASPRSCAASTCSSPSTPAGSSIEGDEITAKGVDVDRIRRRVGIVFQAFNLFPHMSVLDNVTLAPRKVLRQVARRRRARRAARCWSGSASPTRRPRAPTSCRAASSSGWRSSGRSPCSPTSCCSTRSRRRSTRSSSPRCSSVIRELAAGGMTMVIATHEMGFARDIANRVCFLDGGQILEQGPPAQMFARAPRGADPAVPQPDHRGRAALARPGCGGAQRDVAGPGTRPRRTRTAARTPSASTPCAPGGTGPPSGTARRPPPRTPRRGRPPGSATSPPARTPARARTGARPGGGSCSP